MKKLTIPIVMGLLCLSFWARGQGSEVHFEDFVEAEVVNPSRELKVGDRLPAEFWTFQHQILKNGKIFTKNLSEYKGKWLVLDFWATNCGGCIKEMPKSVELNNTFSNKFNLLLVNSFPNMDTLPKLSTFFTSQFDTDLNEQLTSVILDKELKSLFPHRFIGHYIWIDKRGIVRGITNGVFLNKDLVQSITQFY